MTKVMVRFGAAGLLALAGTAIGAGYATLTPAATPLRTAAQEAGEYQLTTAATVVDGSGGSFNNVKVYAPWILDSTDALQNAAVVANVNGNLAAVVATFLSGSPNINATAMIAALGTTDAAGGAVGSNNVFLYEGRAIQHGLGNFLSDTPGAIASNGTVVYAANFNSSFGQNNIEFSSNVFPPVNTPMTAGVTFNMNGVPMFDGSIAGINGVGSGAFLPVPSSVLVDGSDLLVAMTTFGGTPPGPGLFLSGTGVWRYTGTPITDPGETSPEWAWDQVNTPTPTGESVADVRQAKPVIMSPDFGCATTDKYIVFGAGYSGGTPFTGSAANPLYLIVDRMPAGGAANGFADGFVYIDADGDGNSMTASNDLRFVSGGQATGSNSRNVEGYDINSKGQVVVGHENRSGSLTIYQLRLYNPIISNCEIVGYEPPIIIAESGQTFSDGVTTIEPLYTTIENPPGTFLTDFINPFSGVSIDDNGRVAYAAAIEGFYNTSNPNGDRLVASTTALFVYDSATASTHKIVQGGQNGTILPNVVSGPNLMVGRFSNDQESDQFNANGMSKTGGFMTIAFRDGSDTGANDEDMDGFDDNGGVLAPGGAEQRVRGVLTIELGDFTTVPTCAGDITGDGMTNVDDLNQVLGAWNSSVGVGDPRDVAGNDGFINVDDLNVILSNWNCPN
nr:hypothetical protein [uncultured bacterium]